MYGVKFGDKRSWSDFGLILTDYKVSAAVPKRNLIEVPGRNGLLDVTNSVTPYQTYENRTIQMSFIWKSDPDDYEEDLHKLTAALHGKQLKVVLENDPDFYYDGYVTVEDPGLEGRKKAMVEILADVYPYKFKIFESKVKRTGNGSVNCVNDSMPVVPVITNTAQATIVFGERTVTLSAGTHKVAEFVLTEGDNNMDITSTGTTEIVYRQGRL